MKSKNLAQLIDHIIRADTLLLTFLLPVFFLTITTDFYDFNKKILLLLGAGIIVLFWLIRNMLARNIRLTLTPALIPLILLTGISFISLTLAGTNQLQAFMDHSVVYLALTLLYLIITTRIRKNKQVGSLISTLILSGSVLGIISFLQFSQFTQSLLPNAPDWLKAASFSPAGTPLALLSFLTPVFFLSITSSFRQGQKLPSRFLYFTATAIIGIGLSLTTINTISEKNISILPLSSSVQITFENFKSPKSALIGSGPASFVESFTANKPTNFNLSQMWNLRFSAATNQPLQIATTLGLLGLAAYLWILFTAVKSARPLLAGKSPNPLEKIVTAALFVSIIVQFLVPFATLSLFLFVLLLALQQTIRKLETDTKSRDILLRISAVSVVKPNYSHIQTRASRKELLPFIIGLPLSLAVIIGLYLSTNSIYAAEVTFKQSLDAAQDNRGTDTYNLQIKAIEKNPREDRYRTAYALTNLALANSLASQTTVSQADRENITQLIQQAIREAKAATEINPARTTNWETLATVYRNLINVAEGANQWAIASYVEAIKTDPNNPRLRLDLGGIYYGTGDFDQAIRFFDQAVLLKPDWSNAHYNLSAAHREKGDIQVAIKEMQLVLQQIDPSSTDYAKAQTELATLNETLGQAVTPPLPTDSQLTEPEPLPSPVPESQQVELSQDSGIATDSALPSLTLPSPNPTQ